MPSLSVTLAWWCVHVRQPATRGVERRRHPIRTVVGFVIVQVVATAVLVVITTVTTAAATVAAPRTDAVARALPSNAVLRAVGAVATAAAPLTLARVRTVSPSAVGRATRAHAAVPTVGPDTLNS
jgi:hypothetical protein